MLVWIAIWRIFCVRIPDFISKIILYFKLSLTFLRKTRLNSKSRGTKLMEGTKSCPQNPVDLKILSISKSRCSQDSFVLKISSFSKSFRSQKSLRSQNPVDQNLFVLKIPSIKIPSLSKFLRSQKPIVENPVAENPFVLKIQSLKIPSSSKSRRSKSPRSQNPFDLKIPSFSKSLRSLNPFVL